jgi:arylsulfatase A-like enzyme/Flp pilus assembly protein TadD
VRARHLRARRVVAAALALVAAAGVGLFRARTRVVQRDSGLSVLLVSIDTLRADVLGCYGRADAGTPWIDRLAAGGVRFETARAHNVVTLPSHANLLSGRLPTAHGVHDNSGFRFPPETPTLAAILRDAGWRTGAFVSAFVLDSRFGLDRGFEVYDDRLGGGGTSASFAVPERPATRTVAAARLWIDSMAGQRWFAFVHLYEPHFPYAPPEPFASRFAGRLYQGEVAAADTALGSLLAPILAAKNGRVLVVLTSDHGESLDEHGEATHGIFAYDATLRVPLVFYAPGILAPAVVRTPVRHVDVLPTVLDALGLPAPAGLPGRSLLGLDARGADHGDSYFEALSASLDRGWAPLRGVVEGELKYVDLPLPELYDLRADPREEKNLVAARPRDVERLRGRLSSLRAAEASPAARVEEERGTLDALRALGYVSGGGAAAKEHYGEDDDPKRLVDLDARGAEALALYQRGEYDRAAAACTDMLHRRPDMRAVWLQLAAVERARGRLDAAIDAARAAVRLQPLDAAAASFLGVYLTEAGRAAEAVSLLEPYARPEAADPDVLTALGMAQARTGRTEASLATFTRLLDRDPTNALALVNLGTVYLMAGDRATARQAFESALDFDDAVARAHNALGVIAAGEGREDEAIARWKRAAALDPRDYQTLFNLGRTLRERGRPEEARPYLEAYLRAAPRALEARDIARVRAWLGATAGR